MRNKYVFVSLILVVILLASLGLTGLYVNSGDTEDKDKFNIVTSFYPIYIACMNITDGADNVELTNLSEPKTGCLHDFQMTPQDMILLSKADAFVVNGGGIESFIADVADSYPDIQIIESTADVNLIEESDDEAGHEHHEGEVESEEDEHSHEDVESEEDEHTHEEAESEDDGHTHEEAEAKADGHTHEDVESEEDEHTHEESGEGHVHSHDSDVNAHAWMSVADYRIMVNTIAQQLALLDQANSEIYLANARAYDSKLADLQTQQEELKAQLSGKNVVIFHEAYEYVAQDYGMNVVYCLDLDEERAVSAGEISQVISAVETEDAGTILAEELYGHKAASTVSSETSVSVVYLDPLNKGDYDKDSYIDGMSANIQLLRDNYNVKEH